MRRLLAMRPEWHITAFGALLVLAVFWLHGDFGLSWDETVEIYDNQMGQRAWMFWTGGLHEADTAFNKGHNPAILGLYYALHQLLGGDSADLFHLVTGLFGVLGVLLTYRVARRFLPHPWALTAAALLCLSPRFVGHAFTNFKDLPFAVAWLLSIETTLLAAERPTWPRVLAAGGAIGLLLASRFGGLIFLPIALAALVLGAREAPAPQWPRRWVGAALAVAFAIAITYLTYPYLLWHPIAGLRAVVHAQANFQWDGTTLTLGQSLPAQGLPVWYLPVWLGVTLPEPVLAGLAFALALVLPTVRRITTSGAVLGLGAFLPLGYVILGRTPLYDGARHVFFVVPPLTIIATIGLFALHRRLRGWFVPGAVAVALGAMLLLVIRLHPVEAVSFNVLAGGPEGAQGRFTIDYWGASSKLTATWLRAQRPPPARLCVVGQNADSWAHYMPGWGVDDAPGLASCSLDSDLAFVANRERFVADAASAGAGWRWQERHRFVVGGALLGVVYTATGRISDPIAPQ